MDKTDLTRAQRFISSGGAIAIAVLLWIIPAQGADSLWQHNNSTVVLIADGPQRLFRYRDPRPGLRELGIADASLLFDGRRDGNAITGTAYVFKKGCDPAPYSVSGTVSNETEIVLVGAAPVREANGCAVVRYTSDSPHARLVFTYKRRAE